LIVARQLLLGASREPSVQVVLPALLTFVSAFGAYIFVQGEGKPCHEGQSLRAAIPTAILFLILAAVFCTGHGSSMRQANEAAARDYDRRLARTEAVVWPLELEIGKTRLQRENAVGEVTDGAS
jgi:hypothetical protein